MTKTTLAEIAADPYAVSCGCCDAGCVCEMHKRKPWSAVCRFHVEHGHPKTTDPRRMTAPRDYSSAK